MAESSKFAFGRRGFKYFIGYKDNAKCFQKWVHAESILMKQNIGLFW